MAQDHVLNRVGVQFSPGARFYIRKRKGMTLRKLGFALMVLSLATALFGCDRAKWGYAGKTKANPNQPAYTVEAEVHPKP